MKIKTEFNDDFSWDSLFQNYHLTELCTIKNAKKKSVGNNYSVHLALSHVLSNFGINVFGEFRSTESLHLVGCNLKSDFDINNHVIISQMYGFENIKVDIGLPFIGDTSNSFWFYEFDSNEKSFVLKELSFGSNKQYLEFNSFSELWGKAKELEKELESIH